MGQRIYKSTEPFFLQGEGENAKTAVPMVHGFTESPSEFRRIGYFLNDLGYTVNTIRLPGHGTKPEDMLLTGWKEWCGHVLHCYEAMLRHSYDRQHRFI